MAKLRRHGRSRSPRVQRIGEQVVVPEILVPAKQHSKVVPFVFVEAQAGHVIRIPAVTKVAETEIVEQEAFVIQRAHVQRVIEQPKARTEIHECIVGVEIAIDPASPVTRLDGLLDVVVSGILPLVSPEPYCA